MWQMCLLFSFESLIIKSIGTDLINESETDYDSGRLVLFYVDYHPSHLHHDFIVKFEKYSGLI